VRNARLSRPVRIAEAQCQRAGRWSSRRDTPKPSAPPRAPRNSEPEHQGKSAPSAAPINRTAHRAASLPARVPPRLFDPLARQQAQMTGLVVTETQPERGCDRSASPRRCKYHEGQRPVVRITAQKGLSMAAGFSTTARPCEMNKGPVLTRHSRWQIPPRRIGALAGLMTHVGVIRVAPPGEGQEIRRKHGPDHTDLVLGKRRGRRGRVQGIQHCGSRTISHPHHGTVWAKNPSITARIPCPPSPCRGAG